MERLHTRMEWLAAHARVAFLFEYDQVSGVTLFFFDDAGAGDRADSVARRRARCCRWLDHHLRPRAVFLLHAAHPVDPRAGVAGIEGQARIREPLAVY